MDILVMSDALTVYTMVPVPGRVRTVIRNCNSLYFQSQRLIHFKYLKGLSFFIEHYQAGLVGC